MNLKLEIKWALIFTMATLFWSLLEKVTGLTSTHIDKFPYFTNIFAVLAITIYILAMKAKRKNLGGVLPWKKGFSFGILMTGYIFILTPLSLYITLKWIMPEFFNNTIQWAVTNNKMSLYEAENYFTFNNYLLQSLITDSFNGGRYFSYYSFVLRKKK